MTHTHSNHFFEILLVIFLSICSCKKEDNAIDACIESKSELIMEIASYGHVKHPIPSGVFFNEGQIIFQPGLTNFDQIVEFSDLSFLLDNSIEHQAFDSLPFWEIENLPIGTHNVSVELECERLVFLPFEADCTCSGDERITNKEFEVISSTYIIFDSLLYNKAIGCNWDFPGDPCADLDFDFQYYDSDLVIPIYYNYQGPSSPFHFGMHDTIPIYPESCSLSLSLEDYDQIGNSEEIETWTLDGASMGNWNTGTYELGDGLTIQITRL